LISAPGLSGYEGPIRSIIEEAWRPLVDELSTGKLGSLHGLKRGDGPEPRPRILIATHMDAIGLIVSSQVGQFLHFTQIGGVDPRILPGQRVVVHGREDLVGVVVQPPDRLLPPGSGEKPVPMEHLLIDLGLTENDLKRHVRVGDVVSFDQAPLELSGDALAGHSLDNRASVAAMTICLQELKNRRHAWDVYAAATSQEEVTLGGGSTSAFEVHPDLAVAVDVTHAKGPGTTSDYGTYNLGKGVALGWGPNVHPAIFNAFKEIAEDREIPFEVEPMPTHSGTDAFAMQIAAEGIPSMVLSIPLRYMHTPVEEVSLKDVHRAGRLLAEFISWLPVDFISTISFEKSS
jgi:endoglucanase